MEAPHDGLPTTIADPDMDARCVLDRLRGGWRPGGRHLADAAVIEKWRVLATPGPYMLVGVLDGRRHVAEPLIALDPGAGWARLADRWLILGAPKTGAHRLITPAEVMRRAAAWIDRRADDPD
jgi:hypothetical protein